MSAWSVATWVVGGACVGVCVMVAAPVLAPIGSVTAAGALIGAALGGTMGGVAGGVRASADGDMREAEAKRAKDAEAKAAEYAIVIEKLKERLRKEAAKRQPYKAFMKFVEAFSAIGFSIATRDGTVDGTLRETIEEYVVGSGAHVLPPELKQQIASLAAAPPSFNEALKYYALLDPRFSEAGLMELVDDLIAVIADSQYVDQDAVAAWDAAWRHRRGETAAANDEGNGASARGARSAAS
jgi:hypothetical protein